MIGLTKWMFLGEFVDMVTVDTLNITPEMLRLIAQIDEFKGAWKALGTLAPERLTALRRVADAFPDVELVYPVHLSPVVQEAPGGHHRKRRILHAY